MELLHAMRAADLRSDKGAHAVGFQAAGSRRSSGQVVGSGSWVLEKYE